MPTRPVFVSGLVLAAAATAGATDVLTYHNDLARTGANTSETTLTPATVSGGRFRRIASLKVDGYVYAQPLVATGVQRKGRPRDLLVVATEHDRVFAFDVTGKRPRLAWKRALVGKGERPVNSATEAACGDLVPEIGITSTPVIHRATETIYVLAKLRAADGRYHQRLHALDLATGKDKPGSPVEIQASVAGTGDGNEGGTISFNPLRHNQRAALTLVDGKVFIAWASHCDIGPYHGWVMAYDAATLQQTAVWNATPDGGLGGIWHAGGAISADAAGGLYAVTGNGTFGGRNFGDSAVRLTTSLALVDSFTPFNQAVLEDLDIDLGSGAPLVLPDQAGAHPHELVFGGKDGSIYLLDRDAMGGFHEGDDSQIVQALPSAIGGCFGTPAYWNGRVYFHGNGDTLKAFALTDGRLSTSPVSDGGLNFDFPGATPVVSSNGDADGVVWELRTDRFSIKGPAVLYAYDALDLSNLLFSSDDAKRDWAGPAVKFAVPTVANGRVYVGGVKRVTVYGLR
jgi:hypothetical protein